MLSLVQHSKVIDNKAIIITSGISEIFSSCASLGNERILIKKMNKLSISKKQVDLFICFQFKT